MLKLWFLELWFYHTLLYFEYFGCLASWEARRINNVIKSSFRNICFFSKENYHFEVRKRNTIDRIQYMEAKFSGFKFLIYNVSNWSKASNLHSFVIFQMIMVYKKNIMLNTYCNVLPIFLVLQNFLFNLCKDVEDKKQPTDDFQENL